MINDDQIRDLLNAGGTVIGNDGEKIGSLGQVFLDDETGDAEWITVRTGLFGVSESFVPLQDATVKGDEVHVPYSKETVKDAPRIHGSDDHLDRDAEQELYRHYQRSYEHDLRLAERTGHESEGALPSDPDTRDDVNRGGPNRGQANGDDTARDERGLSEERGPGAREDRVGTDGGVPLGTAPPAGGRVRLRKYVVTENVTKTVPVSHEEVRLERVPADDAGDADGTRDAGDEEVTLYEERLVISKERVPVERVRIDTQDASQGDEDDQRMRRQRLDTGQDTGDDRREGRDPDHGQPNHRRDR